MAKSDKKTRPMKESPARRPDADKADKSRDGEPAESILPGALQCVWVSVFVLVSVSLLVCVSCDLCQSLCISIFLSVSVNTAHPDA